jgi:hypothetical protein
MKDQVLAGNLTGHSYYKNRGSFEGCAMLPIHVVKGRHNQVLGAVYQLLTIYNANRTVKLVLVNKQESTCMFYNEIVRKFTSRVTQIRTQMHHHAEFKWNVLIKMIDPNARLSKTELHNANSLYYQLHCMLC